MQFAEFNSAALMCIDGTWISLNGSNKMKDFSKGCLDKSTGYRLIQLQINGKKFKANVHRIMAVAFLGLDINDKSIEVDHINGDRSDNRLENLKLGSKSDNQRNRASHRAGRLIGAVLDKRRNKWNAMIWHDNKTKFLGSFDTEVEAHNTYMAYDLSRRIKP